MGLRDIDFVTDEQCGIPSSAGEEKSTMAWQRYHEVLVREDSSEIYGRRPFTIYCVQWMVKGRRTEKGLAGHRRLW